MSGLDNFNWGGTQPVEFFGEMVEPQQSEVPSSPTQEEPKVEEPKEETTKEPEEEISFFGDTPDTLDLGEEVATDKIVEKKPKTTKVGNYYQDIFQDLKDKGFYQNVELEEGQELTAETLLDLQEKEITERIAAWGQDKLGAVGAEFLTFLRDGGDPAQFISMQKQLGEIPVGDLSDESYQEQVVRYTLATDGWDAEEIEDRLDMLKSTGKLGKIASKYDLRVSEERESIKEQTLQQEKQSRLKAQKEFEEYKQSLAETAKATAEIKGYKITPAKANKVIENLTRPSVRTEDGRMVTRFQEQMSNIMKDPSKALLIAALAESDFDFSQIQKSAESKATKQIKRNIENHAVSSSSNPGGSYGDIVSLADIF